MHLNRVGPGGRSRRAAPAGDRFVVPETLVAEDDVVHRALRTGGQSKRGEHDINHSLRRFGIPADDRWKLRSRAALVCFKRPQDASRDLDRHGVEHAGVQRKRRGVRVDAADQQSQAIQHRSGHDAGVRVQVRCGHRSRAVEVEPGIACACDRDRNADRRAIVETVPGGRRELAVVREASQCPPGCRRGCRVEVTH